jgi:uncharacterized protein YdeI (YjbR/CyaY-like superfamily)
MEITKTLYVTDRDEWRAWLGENSETESEIWLIYYKRHTGIPSIPYGDSVEEAVCFGWIDSIIKRIDDEKFVRKFTPRKQGSGWSELNIRRAKKMRAMGKMTEKGMKLFKNATITKRKHLTLPPELEKELKTNKRAWENFTSLAPSYKKRYIGWILDAKKKETRKRRLSEAIERLEKNEKLGMK